MNVAIHYSTVTKLYSSLPLETPRMASCATGLLLCLICNICFTASAATVKGKGVLQPTVVTKYGKLQGTLLKVKGTDRQVEAYLGIPFAKPPVGPLRFSSPQPAECWNGVRDATSNPPMCLQSQHMIEVIRLIMKTDIPPLPVSEDCLYLNVYTSARRKKKSKLPVMVFIHGGAFVFGGAIFSDGSPLSAYEDVVVVVIQYRLGVLGFFRSEDADISGNWGILDQIQALHWIQENIEGFGGDPHSVTIFGESAGGISVSALILSPLSKGLFHKAISESGVARMPHSIISDPQKIADYTNKIANLSGCEDRDSAATVNCLRNKTEDELLNSPVIANISVVPVIVDGVLLQKSPEKFLPDELDNPVPYLLGINNHEYGWLLPSMAQLSRSLQGAPEENVTTVFLDLLKFMIPNPETYNLVIEEYLGDTEDPIQRRDRVLELFGDWFFVIPAVQTARYHRDSGLPVYLYEFQHRLSTYGDSRPDYVKADHADEIGFVFGSCFLDTNASLLSNATEKEKCFSRKMMKYWANFARTGNPNSDELVTWPIYDQAEQYLELDLQQKTGTKLKDDRVTFWTEILPEKLQQKTNEKK
ncbi:fatty acyl-CoA hydrolase precursor, medium chain [Microcaecilia unicolor]|uniref:Carboxylic ester hydrolase n=1 Tax=Microcaecilia unicolor TaxID=1415580 RepID=A0A6P7YBW0_9AMPH|nr:fatty acyl-CoA hydrolase precursor, medium chain-like [Microcaecilia unicolor]